MGIDPKAIYPLIGLIAIVVVVGLALAQCVA